MKKNPPTTPSIQVPTPLELAKLAAQVAPHDRPAEALTKAMGLLVEAAEFCRTLPATSEELIKRFSSAETLFIKTLQSEWSPDPDDTLILDPSSKTTDPVRRFLADCGEEIKGHRAVIKTLTSYWNTLPAQAFGAEDRPEIGALLKRWEDKTGGNTRYAIPRWLLKGIVGWRKSERSRMSAEAYANRSKTNPVK